MKEYEKLFLEAVIQVRMTEGRELECALVIRDVYNALNKVGLEYYDVNDEFVKYVEQRLGN